uniref:Myb/SANT-like DNA-binding domain-containing protein n=1 Tax=Pelusios castaneus TaxID=367368 RepID=A0A8C8R5T8_9SAUR
IQEYPGAHLNDNGISCQIQEFFILFETCCKPRFRKAGNLKIKRTLNRRYKRDTLQCKVKVKELRISYYRAREANRCSGSAPATCQFYKELEAILCRDPTSIPKTPVDMSAPLHCISFPTVKCIYSAFISRALMHAAIHK